MSPTTLNTVLTIGVLLFVVNGFFQGLVHMIGSFIGLVLGILAASRWDAAGGAWLAAQTGWDKNVCVLLAFILILILFTRLFGVIVHFLEKALNIMKIPLVGIANKLVGAALGFFEGVFVAGSTLLVAQGLPFPDIAKTIAASSVAVALISAAKIIIPLLPKAIRDLYK
jgi:uncharacterized membrane protein required for colicin V production